jgi:hypothetical protein
MPRLKSSLKTDNDIHRHVFPILDALIQEALSDLDKENITISCKKGCNHCCYLLVEVSMEEAQCLARWILSQSKTRQTEIIKKIQANAEEAKILFSKSRRSKKHIGAVDIQAKIENACFDKYFYEKKRLCPFNKKGACMAYEARPSACRLHMVSSDPVLCQHDVENDEDYEVPARIEEAQKEFAPINTAVSKDGRWGHLGILVEIALKELGAL